jgi:hypothetical protein
VSLPRGFKAVWDEGCNVVYKKGPKYKILG